MAGFGDVKSRKMKRALRRLARTGKLSLTEGGKHYSILHVDSGDKIPIPLSHKTVNKHIVKNTMKWLVDHKVCTEEEFEKLL